MTIKYISIHIAPEFLTEPPPCPLCDSPMVKTEIEYEFRDGTTLIKNDEPVPGYRCQSCGAEYHDGPISLLLYKATLPVLHNKSELVQPLKESIRTLENALKGK